MKIRITRMLAILLVLLAPPIAHAATGDETLIFYLKRADLVVVAQIDSDPNRALVHEGGYVLYHILNCKLIGVLKGKKLIEELEGKELDDKHIGVTAIRFVLDKEDDFPWFKEGTKCILFLKHGGSKTDGVPWKTVDPWFGIQRFSPTFAKSLKRVAERQGK